MAERIIAKKISKSLFGWAVFVDGVRRTTEGQGLRRSEAQRIVRTIREKTAQEK